MMKKIILFIFLISLAGCGPVIKVYTDRDPDFDLSKYSFYTWEQTPDIESGRNPLYYNELNDKRIKSATNHELAKLGYGLATENPQFTLHYHIIVEDATAIVSDHYSPYWFQMQTNIYPYTEGTLIIDIMDTETGCLIWRGRAVSVVDETYDADEIETAVEKIFNNFQESAEL